MMVRYDQQFFSLKNNETLDHVTLPLEIRDKSKFIHDKLEGKIYMERPNGYIDSPLTFKLRNPLYGLKQGPRAWHPKFNPFILIKNDLPYIFMITLNDLCSTPLYNTENITILT